MHESQSLPERANQSMRSHAVRSHEVLHATMLRLMQVTTDALAQDFPSVTVLLSDLSRSETWDAAQNAVYVVPHSVTLNEQGLRSDSTREKVMDPNGGEEIFRFYRAPLPLTLHFLFVPCTTTADSDLKLLGRLYQLLHEQPILTRESPESPSQDAEMRQTLGPDMRLTPDQLRDLFFASRITPRLAVPCLIRCMLRSEQVMREARPSRSIRGQVQRS